MVLNHKDGYIKSTKRPRRNKKKSLIIQENKKKVNFDMTLGKKSKKLDIKVKKEYNKKRNIGNMRIEP